MSDRALLRQAFIDATIELADECATGERIECSARHRKRLRSMGISVGLSERTKILIALIAAALLLTGCAVFREQIAGLILSFGDGFVSVEGNVDPDAPREIEHAYVATYLPEGFVETERVEDSFYNRTIWENEENGKYLILTQETVHSFSQNIEATGAKTTKIYYDGYSILKIEASDVFFYYLRYEGYVLSITADFDIDDYALTLILDGLR